MHSYVLRVVKVFDELLGESNTERLVNFITYGGGGGVFLALTIRLLTIKADFFSSQKQLAAS